MKFKTGFIGSTLTLPNTLEPILNLVQQIQILMITYKIFNTIVANKISNINLVPNKFIMDMGHFY